MAVMAARAIKFAPGVEADEGIDREDLLKLYADGNRVSPWAREAMNMLLAQNC